MNEFVAKKLGEVDAFIRLVIDTYEKGEAGFLQTKTAKELHEDITSWQTLRSTIKTLYTQADITEVVVAKSEKTLAKITRARDDYIAERWDDTVELYEWFSFNAGAGAAHAHEVFGAANALDNTLLASTTRQARNQFDSLLADAKDYLYQTGFERAKNG